MNIIIQILQQMITERVCLVHSDDFKTLVTVLVDKLVTYFESLVN